MAAAVHELDGLYFHFKHLLFSGFKADLQIKSENGNALASLTAEIKLVNDYKVVRKKKKRGPSYFNRLEKRKQARNNSCQGNTAEKATPDDNDAINKIDDRNTEEAVSAFDVETTNVTRNFHPTAEEVVMDEGNVAAEEAQIVNVAEEANDNADEAVSIAVDGSSEDMVESNKAEKATPKSCGAEKQPETERRYWLCIFHGCIDNTELEDLECSCCGVECQVVEYDSQEEYEPD